MSSARKRDHGSHDTNVYCLQCQAQIGVVDNQWEKLTASYAKPMLAGIIFNTEISRKTQIVPAGSVQKAAQGCVMAEVLCSCSTMVGQYCVSGSLDFVGQQYFKLSRIVLRDVVSSERIKPIFPEYGPDSIQPLKGVDEKRKPSGRASRHEVHLPLHRTNQPAHSSPLDEMTSSREPLDLQNGIEDVHRDFSHSGRGDNVRKEPDELLSSDNMARRPTGTLTKAVERLAGLERRVDDHSTRLTGLDMRVLRSEDTFRTQREQISEHERLLQARGVPNTEESSRLKSGKRSTKGMQTPANQTTVLDSEMLLKQQRLIDEQQKQIHELTIGLRAAQRNITMIKKKLEANRVALTRRVTSVDVNEHISRALVDVSHSLPDEVHTGSAGEDTVIVTEHSTLKQLANVLLQVARRSHNQLGSVIGKRKRSMHEDDHDDHRQELDTMREDSLFAPHDSRADIVPLTQPQLDTAEVVNPISKDEQIKPLSGNKSSAKRARETAVGQENEKSVVAEAIDFSDDEGLSIPNTTESATRGSGMSIPLRDRTPKGPEEDLSARCLSNAELHTKQQRPTRHRRASVGSARRPGHVARHRGKAISDSVNDSPAETSVHNVRRRRPEQAPTDDDSGDGGTWTNSKVQHTDTASETAAEGHSIVVANSAGKNRRGTCKSKPGIRQGNKTSVIAVEENEDLCDACGTGGKLLCCDRCPKVFHRQCLSSAIGAKADQEGDWNCPLCEAGTSLGLATCTDQ